MINCGATLNNGSQCTREVGDAGELCWQHRSAARLRRNLGRASPVDRPGIIVSMILANRGPGGLDLSEESLEDLDLSGPALERIAPEPDGIRLWLIERFGQTGMNLIGVNLSKATLTRTNLRFARMQLANCDAADLYGADLEGSDLYRADLRAANLYKANLRSAKLERADLSGADLRLADLSGANLLRTKLDGALLNRASIGHHLIQENRRTYTAYVDDDRRLRDFALARRAEPNVARDHLYPLADRTWVKDDIEHEVSARHLATRFVQARDIYLTLEACFAQQSLIDDRSWAHYRARHMQRKSFFPSRAVHCHYLEWPENPGWKSMRAWRAGCRFLAKWIVQYLYEYASGYGERPGRTLACLLAVVVAFTALQFQFTDLGHGPGHHGWKDSILFSLGALTGIGFNDLSPVNAAGKLLASLEAASGISLFALFMFTLGNRMGKG